MSRPRVTVRDSASGKLDTAPDSLQGHYAGFASRAVAWLVDQAIALAIPIVIISIVHYFLNLGAIVSFISLLESLLPGTNAFIRWFLGPQFTVVVALLFFYSYFVFFLSTTGQTVGMALMGLRVVTITGQRLHPGRALVRTLCYGLSLAPFGLGYLWVLGQDQRQAWHDRIARTYVLYVWNARYEENFLRNAVYQLTKKREIKKGAATPQKTIRR
jgi:uncharacterized RDD family membrane protein YckC